MIGCKTKGKLAKEGWIIYRKDMNGLCVSYSEIWREECRSLILCIFNGAPQCFSLGSFQMSTSPPFAFPHQSLWLCQRQLPFVVLMLLPRPTLSCWNCACHGHSLSSAHGQGVQRNLVCLQLQNPAQTHWCTQERESWQLNVEYRCFRRRQINLMR